VKTAAKKIHSTAGCLEDFFAPFKATLDVNLKATLALYQRYTHLSGFFMPFLPEVVATETANTVANAKIS
jgi:hypothetical protein